MFGLFNPKRNADLLLLSEALAETRSELNQLRREYEFLHSSYNDFRNTFLNLEIPEQLEQLKLNIEGIEIPEQLDEYELTEQIERVVRSEAWTIANRKRNVC